MGPPSTTPGPYIDKGRGAPGPSRRSEQRGRGDHLDASGVPVWELHRQLLPVRVEDEETGEATRAEIILCVDRASGWVLDTEVVAAGAPLGDCVRLLLRAVRSAGTAPAAVAVARQDLAAELERALRAVGLGAVRVQQVASLPAAAAALRNMSRALGWDADWPKRYWKTLAGTYADLPGLMRDAAAYYWAAPWELLDDDQILTAHLTRHGETRAARVTRYISVLGGGGQTFGLAVFRTRAGVRAVLEGDLRAARRVAAVAVTFGQLQEADPALRERLRRRYEIAGPAAFPFFMRTPAVGQSRPPEPSALDELRAVLQTVTGWAQSSRSSPAPWPYRVTVTVGATSWDAAMAPFEG